MNNMNRFYFRTSYIRTESKSSKFRINKKETNNNKEYMLNSDVTK